MTGTSSGARSCRSCGARLASDNREPVCRPCQRVRAGESVPPEVPPEFWDTAQLRQALLGERHMGHAVRSYRKHPFHGRRPLPQELMARWLNISQTQLARIERGRPVTDLERLTQWAQALGIPQGYLWFSLPGNNSRIPEHGWQESRSESTWPGAAGPAAGNQPGRPDEISPAGRNHPAIDMLSDSLTNYGPGAAARELADHDEIPCVTELERGLKAAFGAYQGSRYSDAACRSALLLADAQLAVRRCHGPGRTSALRVLALSFQVTASVLTKVGIADLAWIAAERGLRAADESEDPAVRGSLARSVAFSLLAAMRLVEESAEFLRREPGQSEMLLSIYGTLFLAGSMAAARHGDNATTAEYLREAGNAARRTGRDANHLWTAFGPTNVEIHRVNTLVELGAIQEALDSGLSLDTTRLPAERRVRYLLDVARVHELTGKRDDAVSALLTAEQIAPEQVRGHYLGRRVVSDLMRGTVGRMPPQLNGLAVRVRALEPT
jgi:hypothetical protein